MREMGKAMMGTGEAEGEKRAMTAAEAAISNPLIDDASMKGAKGLLISISGGRDLTLYEVDEAATRIREEVDQDANIIVGATFDEGLEGIIRVSVVATGIDHALAQRPPVAAAEARIAEVAQRLRADNERLAQRLDRAEPARAAVAAPPPLAPPQPAGLNESIESAKAAMAAAILPQGPGPEVTIRPLGPKPSLFIDPATQPVPPEALEPETFIPPQPERMPQRGMRMPRIDELPVPAQKEIRARRGELQDEHPEKRRTSLLQRLAAVGLGRRDDDEEIAPMPPKAVAPMPAMPQVPPMSQVAIERPQGRPLPRQEARPEPRPEPVSEYAKRPAPHGLDQHGRQLPVHNRSEEDQLDIPAFLRRQAN
jgi:cell division protein FtsZ